MAAVIKRERHMGAIPTYKIASWNMKKLSCYDGKVSSYNRLWSGLGGARVSLHTDATQAYRSRAETCEPNVKTIRSH